ncbi:MULTISPECIES: sugar phosphate isomerase/epimerase family protein [Streptosporangium]|uniref:Inosose dehydratase n=1 Tax=Streptosporangium brasiliense TaxID=47480 RepID=A0ABT9QX29_9ACTN|nr:sugar phosphate isomerase/epimerase [Streptosporangium brasiliense]MDP9861551.1 inosose dehydratase [Streptosporangium brasiliense]
MAVKVANAPVNFGIYRADGAPLDPDALLGALAEAGYDGIDSGPIGYLGTGPELRERLARTGMGLAGGWVDLRYEDADGFTADLAGLDAALAVFTSAPAVDGRFAPRPTLACPAHPERSARGAAPGLPDAAWAGFASRVQRAADRCRDRGLEPVFHHHLGTLVETSEEVERLLELTDVSLCLDTGHLWLAGGDPVAALREWGGRIRQLHLKDASRRAHDRVRAAGGDLTAVVAGGAFPPLGAGEVDLPGVLDGLGGYEGWLVVEQDVPGSGQDLGRALEDQRANRAWLRAHGC